MGNRSYLESTSGLVLETNNSEAYYWSALLSPETLERHRPAWEDAVSIEERAAATGDASISVPKEQILLTVTAAEAREPLRRFGAAIARQVPEQGALFAEFVRVTAGEVPDDTQLRIDYEELSWFSSTSEFFADLRTHVAAATAGDLTPTLASLREDPISDGFGLYNSGPEPGPAWRSAAAAGGYL